MHIFLKSENKTHQDILVPKIKYTRVTRVATRAQPASLYYNKKVEISVHIFFQSETFQDYFHFFKKKEKVKSQISPTWYVNLLI